MKLLQYHIKSVVPPRNKGFLTLFLYFYVFKDVKLNVPGPERWTHNFKLTEFEF